MSDSVNFEKLRKEAKTILKLCRAGDRTALDRMRAQLPRLAAFNDEDAAAQIQLADIHHALARELGHSNWADLKRHDDPVARYLAAVRSGALESAQEELRRSPHLARESIHAACALGDADAVRYHLDLDSSLVSSEESGWQPLLYVCGSPFCRLGGRHAFALYECAQVLLDRGADPNVFSLADAADPDSKIHARTRAVMNKNQFVFVLLGQRGGMGDLREVKAVVARTRSAPPPVSPSIMDFLTDPGFREELSRRVAPIRAREPKIPTPFQMSIKMLMELDHEDDGTMLDSNLALFRLALERGADPNAQNSPNKQTALHSFAALGPNMGMGMPLAELFLKHGADPNLAAADGTTPYSIAVRMGNAPLANVLLAHGAKADSASPADQFIGACRRGSSEAALGVVQTHPDVLKTTGSEHEQMLYTAIVQNHVDSVKLMAKVGFDLTAVGNRGASALHYAAWHGHVEMVRFLIEYHLPVNARDALYGTSPLAWATHGSASSKHWRDADDDYCAVVESLINAGASYEAACNKWNVGPEQIGSDRVVALLKGRGFCK